MFTPREGTELAMSQRVLEEKLAGEGVESGSASIEEGTEPAGEVENLEAGDSGADPGEETDEEPDEDSNIASRVVGRRGRRQREGADGLGR